MALKEDSGALQKNGEGGFTRLQESWPPFDGKGQHFAGDFLDSVLGVTSRGSFPFTELLVAVEAEVISQGEGDDIV